jgi:hypothetical protein
MKLYESLAKQLKNEPNFVTDNGELKKMGSYKQSTEF